MRLRRLALGRHPDLKPWPAELNRHRIESASPWPAPLRRIRRTRKTRPELDEITRELVLAFTSLSSQGAASILKYGGIIILAGRGRGILRGRGRGIFRRA